jgi:hypothetical protein
MVVSKADKKTSITSARDKFGNSNNNNGTKNKIKNTQSSVVKSNYHHYYYKNIHSISSSPNYQTKGKNDGPSSNNNNTHFTRQKRSSIDYDKYLIGRSYQLFKSAIRSERTMIIYKNRLWHFCNFLQMTTEEIASKYGADDGNYCANERSSMDSIDNNNNYNENNYKIQTPFKLQQKVEDYVLLIQTRLSNNNFKRNSINTLIPPVKLFCEMNDIILNWKKIGKLLPRYFASAVDQAYTREQIKKMLEHSDLRTKIPILFMSSSGMRLGGFVGLTNGCINPIYDDDNGKILAAHVVVYKGEPEQYDTFISPEAWQVYDEYRNLRIKFGEQITENSPILLKRFDISPDGKKATFQEHKV